MEESTCLKYRDLKHLNQKGNKNYRRVLDPAPSFRFLPIGCEKKYFTSSDPRPDTYSS